MDLQFVSQFNYKMMSFKPFNWFRNFKFGLQTK